MKKEDDIDPLAENQRAYKYEFLTQYLTIFLSSVGFSISLPSIYPYMQTINNKSTKSELGLIIAIFSIGQFMGGPAFGILAQTMKSFKYPILISLIHILLGNFLYSNLLTIGNPKWGYFLMLISRYVIGFGAGNTALTQAYITTFSEPKYKTGRVAVMSACQGLGFIFGPSLQLLFSFLGYPGVLDNRYFKFNMFTGPGYFGVLTCGTNILVIIFFFMDKDPNDAKELNETAGLVFNKIRRNTANFVANPISYIEKGSSIIRSSILINISKFRSSELSLEETKTIEDVPNGIQFMKMSLISLIFFSTMFFFSSLETILTPMIMDQFGLEKSTATFYSSICLASAGLCSLIVFVGIRIFSSKLEDRLVLTIGHESMTVACLGLIPYHGAIPIIKYNNSQLIGCPLEEQKWCNMHPALQLFALILVLLFFTVGFSLINVSTTIMFAKCLAPGSQTLWMGLLTSVGSAARIAGPFYITNMYRLYGMIVSFGIISGINVTLVLIILLLYSRL